MSNGSNGPTQTTFHFIKYKYGKALFFCHFHTVNKYIINLLQCQENLNARYIRYPMPLDYSKALMFFKLKMGLHLI